MKRSFAVVIVLLVAAVMSPGLAAVESATATIAVNSSVKYQVMTGWEATAQAGQCECAGFAQYRDSVFDQAANDLGINRLRVELNIGAENPVDYFARFQAGQIDFGVWLDHASESVNDNDDPQVINWNGYHFSALDHQIDTVVLPMRQRLAARGESLYVNLNVVAFDPGQGQSNVDYRTQPAEYGELILAAFQHIKSRYGWVPDAVEVVLEPDMAGWGSGTPVGNALVAAGQRLDAQGYRPAFIATSTMDMLRAIWYFDQMVQVPGVLSYLTDLSYHRYANVSDANLQALGSRGVQYGIRTAMLEHIGSDYHDLHNDLKVGRNSAWQQYTLAFCTDDNGAQYYWVNGTQANLGSQARFLRQYFKFIRRGAQRIEATTTDSRIDPLAFINTDGRYVVVIKADVAGGFSIQGLPAGAYGIKYTTASQYNVDLPDVVIAAGQPMAASVPGGTVVTVYGKAASAATATPTRTGTSVPAATNTPTRTRTNTPVPAVTNTPTRTNTPAGPGGYVKRVNLGGGAYTDGSGNLWEADQPYSSGGWGYTYGSAASTVAAIANTTDDALYQTYRTWPSSSTPAYSFSVPNGRYEVTLKFMEPAATGANQRKFDIRSEGSTVVSGFDIFAACGGQNRAVDRTFNITVSDGVLMIGVIDLNIGDALISAIQVRPATGGTQPTNTPTRTRTPMPGTSGYLKRVNTGGAAYVDAQGNLWEADQAYAQGGWGYTGGSVSSTAAAIANTGDDRLYQIDRNWSASSTPGYTFNVPAGRYEVTLKFAETQFDHANERAFDIRIRGVTVIAGLDIYAAAGGWNRAVDRVVTVDVPDGVLNIGFIHLGLGDPKVNAIQVRKVR